MTLPAFAGLGTESETSVAWPAGHAAGHFALLAVEHGNDSASIATPSGWSTFDGSVVSTGASNTTLTLFYMVATSGAMANAAIDFNVGGTQNHKFSQMVTYSGVNLQNPIHAQTSGIWGPATTAVAWPAPQTLLDDCMIVHFGTWSNDDATGLGSTPVNATLGSVTQRFSLGTATGNGGGLYIFDGTLASHALIEPSTATFSSAIIGAQLVLALTAADKTLPTLARDSRFKNTGGM